MQRKTMPQGALAALCCALLIAAPAFAAIEEFDTNTASNNATSGQLACSAPGRVAATAPTRLPAVAGEITEVKLHGSDLRAADYDFSLAGCNGSCNVIEATGSGSLIRVRANLGGAGQSTALTARKRGSKEAAVVRFNIVDNIAIANVTPRDGVLIGSTVQVSGSGLSALELSAGNECFDVQGKTASAITLRSKCELGNPAAATAVQTLGFARSGSAGCTMKFADKSNIRLAASQQQPVDLVADFGPFSASSRVDAVTPDRRVADSFCTGGNSEPMETTTSCSSLPGAATRAGQGIGNDTTCVVTSVPTTLFKRALAGTVRLTAKNASATTAINKPFDMEIRDGTSNVVASKRVQTLNANGQITLDFVRPFQQIGYVKITEQSSAQIKAQYGAPGCYRARGATGAVPAQDAAGNYSETGFTGVVDARNEIDEGANGKANNSAQLVSR